MVNFMLCEFCPHWRKIIYTLSTGPGRRSIRSWSRHACYYYVPKAIISWYLCGSSVASRIPGDREVVYLLELQPKQCLSRGLGKESEGPASRAWKGPSLTCLAHTRCFTVPFALLISSTCLPLGSHVLGVYTFQTTSHCWEFKVIQRCTWVHPVLRMKLSNSILFQSRSNDKINCWPSSSSFQPFARKLQPTL